jgi:hypothetical protein
MSQQKIEAPTSQDVSNIASSWLHASEVSLESLGAELDGTEADLHRIQRILDSGTVERDATSVVSQRS